MYPLCVCVCVSSACPTPYDFSFQPKKHQINVCCFFHIFFLPHFLGCFLMDFYIVTPDSWIQGNVIDPNTKPRPTIKLLDGRGPWALGIFGWSNPPR